MQKLFLCAALLCTMWLSAHAQMTPDNPQVEWCPQPGGCR